MTLRNKPKFKYSGLTIILSNPSRFDKLRLLSANGGLLFDNYCLRPEYNSHQCDIRLMEDTSPLLPDTKVILLLGESAMHKYLPETLGNTLNEMRGSLFYYKDIPTIASYLPQEAADIKAYEAELNPFSKDYSADDDFSSEEDADEGDVKRHGKTKRANFAFWLRADCSKIKKLLSGFRPENQRPTFKIYPPSPEVIKELESRKGEVLFFDMETDYEEENLQCFSFSFNDGPIYSLPILDFNYKFAYSNWYYIMRALAVAIKNNLFVAWNGATFDYFILAYKYHIPIYDVCDPMIMMHRCFPEIEKSLGHGMSYWTWEKFHKDEDSIGYRTHQQMLDRLKYCAKDTFGMKLCYYEMLKYIPTIPGLKRSVDDAMACIRPYLIATLQGVKVDDKKVAKMISENDGLMMQYNRMTEILIGAKGMQDIRSIIRGKAGIFAGSNKQCCEYFHGLLNYPVMNRSEKTNEPSLGKKSLYRLALKFDNPVIRLVCLYRAIKKETGRLRFIPWTLNDSKYERIEAAVAYDNAAKNILMSLQN